MKKKKKKKSYINLSTNVSFAVDEIVQKSGLGSILWK